MKQRLIPLIGICASCLARLSYAGEGRVLTLDDALSNARANQPQLRAARAQTEQSAARVDEARAPLLPQVSGSASARRSGQGGSSSTGGSGTQFATSTGNGTSLLSGGRTLYSMGLNASQLIYDFGQTTGKWKAARTSELAQRESEVNVTVQVAYNLRVAYYSASADRALVKVAVDTLANQDAHLAQVQGFVQAGTRPEIDLAQARTDRANARVQLIKAQNDYDAAKAQLNQAMGIEAGIDYDVEDTSGELVPGEDGSTDSLLPSALKARPDLLAMARQIDAQILTIKANRGSYGPALSASGGLTDGGSDIHNLTWSWYAQLALNWQFFGGGITAAQIREAQAVASQLRAQYDGLRQQIRLDVEQARLGVRAAKATLEAAHEAAFNARERLRLAEGRYRAGVGNIIELGDAQTAMTTAAGQEVQAQYALASARAKLMQALGRE